MSAIKLWVNAREVEARPDQTVMEAADEAGIIIPRLCYHSYLKPSGSCRLCAVEIEGQRGLPAACSTPVENGMRVVTESPKVQDFRREMLRLILEDHPRECLGCPRNGTCELQQLVAHIGIDFSYGRPGLNRPPAMEGGDYFERDYSLCVRCGRCVRVCHEVRGAKAIIFREKGGRQEVSTPFEKPLPESGCQFCGSCVDVCPVGALRERIDPPRKIAREEMNSICGSLSNLVLDLFSKELPRTVKSSVCPVCSAGCRMIFEIGQNGRILQSRPHPLGPANKGQACVQGRFLLRRRLQYPERPVTPLVRENGKFIQVSWDAALNIAATRLRGLPNGQVAVLTDGRGTNEELYALQKFAKAGLKSDFMGCIAPSGHADVAEALQKRLGVAGASGTFDDLQKAGVIFALGIHAAGDHPIAGTRIRQAVMNGAKLITASAVQNAVTRYADIHLDTYPGTELALLAGLLRLILMNQQTSASHDQNLQALADRLESYSLDEVSRITGASKEKIIEASCLLAENGPLNIVFGKAVLDSSPGASIVEALLTIASVQEDFGGIFPLYGNSNLQGAWDMGIVSHTLIGQAERNAVSPAGIGELVASGKIKGLCLVAESHDSAAWATLEPLLPGMEFVLIQDIALPESIKAILPDGTVFLPMASILEKEGTLTNCEHRIQKVEPVIPPACESKNSHWVVSELARRMGISGLDFENAEAVYKLICKEVPGYSDGSGVKGLQAPLGLDHPLTWIPSVSDFQVESRDKEQPFALISRERLTPYLAGPLSSLESLSVLGNGISIEMNPADAFGMGFQPGDIVLVVTRNGALEGPLAMSDPLPVGTVAIPSHMLDSLKDHTGMNQTIFAARVEKR